MISIVKLTIICYVGIGAGIPSVMDNDDGYHGIHTRLGNFQRVLIIPIFFVPLHLNDCDI